MYLVGITGGIGSGKSIVAEVFRHLGVPVYYADNRSKWLQENDKHIVQETKKLFGKESYLPDGKLNKTHLAALAFSNPELLQELNRLVHPVVASDFENWCQIHQHYPYLVKESALLIETQMHKKLSYLIVVTAPKETRIARILLRDAFRSEQQIHEIMKAQLEDDEKIKFADYTLVNDNSRLILPQILALHRQFLHKSHT